MKLIYDRLQVLKLNIYYCNIIEHCDKDKYFNPKKYAYNFKPAHVVTSIKQSPVLKGHLFLILS
jgi:hypothetical protein